jgi:hypothetical protein
MSLADDLDRIGTAAARFAAPGEQVTAVLAAEPDGHARTYLCAFTSGETTSWLALADDAAPVADLRRVRAAAQLAALCEVAADSAGGDELDDLRAKLQALREHEHPEGIEEAEAAAAALAAALAEEPRVATTAFLDRVGALARALEHALGTDSVSPFGAAMQQALPAVEELAADVERNYKAVRDA